jgi:hypothetical protein
MKREDVPNIDGILTAYALLDPKEGWAYSRRLLADPAVRFTLRYSALRAARYFRTSQPDFMAEKEILAAIRPVLDQDEIADIAIDYLREWKCWAFTKHILGLYTKKEFEWPIVRRAILRYALQCPDAEAARFVEQQRKADASLVEEVEKVLKAEAGKR